MSHTQQHVAPIVLRRELSQFRQMAEQFGIDDNRQCRWLHLSHDDWQRWLGTLEDAPLPSNTELPILLRRLGYLNDRLDRAERLGFA